jgi:dihydroorotate dehydrogenase
MALSDLAGPLLRRLDPERAHDLTIRALEAGLVPGRAPAPDPRVAVDLWDRRFASPVGLAAGFDKDARVIQPMLRLGFGSVEVGSVTPRPQPGNPKPRVFRLPEDRAVINRLGFNSAGLAVAAANLAAYRAAGGTGLVGANLGRNKDSADAGADYAAGVTELARHADWLTVNVSSPNTPGLRALQSRDQLARLLERVQAARHRAVPGTPPPLLLKIAPDLTPRDKRDIADVADTLALDGLIVSNTTVARPADLKGRHRAETGGLSGRPLFAPSTALLAEMYRLTEGRLTLIGVGGIASGADAYAKVRAGASLVQLYTALIYQGPGLAARIAGDLAQLLARDGYARLADAVGADAVGADPAATADPASATSTPAD